METSPKITEYDFYKEQLARVASELPIRYLKLVYHFAEGLLYPPPDDRGGIMSGKEEART